jgi:hypothetical protein
MADTDTETTTDSPDTTDTDLTELNPSASEDVANQPDTVSLDVAADAEKAGNDD